ncbi:MAG: hypothetical protein ACPF9D_00955 [Owenweeksia sp.]
MKSTLLLFSFLLVSCTQKLPVEDFVAWHNQEDNGLYESTESGGYRFQLQYCPHELVALRNASEISNINKEDFVEEVEELKGYQFFNLRISSLSNADFLRTNLSSQEEYYQRIAYFSSFAQTDFKLVEARDTLECIMYHFERNYGIQPFQTVLLGFKNTTDPPEDKEVVYLDRILGLDPVRIKIESKNLKHIPKLSL